MEASSVPSHDPSISLARPTKRQAEDDDEPSTSITKRLKSESTHQETNSTTTNNMVDSTSKSSTKPSESDQQQQQQNEPDVDNSKSSQQKKGPPARQSKRAQKSNQKWSKKKADGNTGRSKGWADDDRRTRAGNGRGNERTKRKEESDEEGGDEEGKQRLPKRKAALLIGYCGTGYSGSQIQPEVKTIEGDIFQALVKAGCVSKDNSVNPVKVGLSRTARTDAGVHAAINVLGIKMILQPPIPGVYAATTSTTTGESSPSTKVDTEAPLEESSSSIKDKTASSSEVTLNDAAQKEEVSIISPKDGGKVDEQSSSTPCLPAAETTSDNLNSSVTAVPPPTLATGAAAESDQTPLINHLNSLLPPTLRIWGYIRANSSFNARTLCDSRSYEYSLPTYVFLPPRPGLKKNNDEDEEAKTKADRKEGDPEELWFWDDKNISTSTTSSRLADPWSVPPDLASSSDPSDPQSLQNLRKQREKEFREDLIMRRKWKISQNMLGRIREILKRFCGSHNFHNFTVGRLPKDKACTRNMKQITVSEPFYREDGSEWITFNFHGQSFMLHQIRKMIAFVILASRSLTPPNLLTDVLYTHLRLIIPKAPSLGLLLDRPHFEGYNSRLEKLNEDVDRAFSRGKLTEQQLDDGKKTKMDFEQWEDKVREFKIDEITKRIWEEEERDGVFAKWLDVIDAVPGPEYSYFHRSGRVPSEAIAENLKKKKAEAEKAKEAVLTDDVVTNALARDDLEDEKEEELFAQGTLDEEG